MKKALFSVASICLVAGSALAVDPMGTEMVPPITGGISTYAYGVNDNGMVVGQADNALGAAVGFVYYMGVTEELPLLPGGVLAQAQGVNNNGVIVGYCDIPNPQFPEFTTSRPVKWNKVDGVWTITDLGTLRADDSGFGVAQRINDAGVIVGYSSRDGGTSYHGTIWNADGTAADAGTLGYAGNVAFSQVLGINQAGDVAGYAYSFGGGPEHGLYLRVGARAEDITTPGQYSVAQWHNVSDDGELGGYISDSSTAGEFRPATYTAQGGFQLAPLIDGLVGGFGYDINNGHTLVGVMYLLDENPNLSVFHAFASRGGETVDLNTVATGIVGTMIEARDVTNNGLIVGTTDNGFGLAQAVLLYPMPVACAGDIGQAGGLPGADGSLDNNDFIAFISLFFAQDTRADIGVTGGAHGHDGQWNNNDFIAFINLFFAGCI